MSAKGENQLRGTMRVVDRVLIVAIGWLGLTVAGLACAVFWPVPVDVDTQVSVETRQLRPLPTTSGDIEGLLVKMAGVRLIRPAQVRAAVKDTGLAKRLLKRLKLQGVVDMGGEAVAYIQIEKQGVATVKRGQTIMDFVVEKIEPGKVTLSLQGVVVELSH